MSTFLFLYVAGFLVWLGALTASALVSWLGRPRAVRAAADRALLDAVAREERRIQESES